MSATRWWWLRHARVTEHSGLFYGRTDVSCDTSNTQVFKALASALPKKPLLLVSPLKRTAETAEALARAGWALPPARIEAELIEQDFGDWTGRPSKEVFAGLGPDNPFWQGTGHTRPPGGESFAEVCARVAGAIARLNAAHQGRDIVAVSHAGVIRAALAHALGLDPGGALAFAIDNCALTRLDHSAAHGGSWAVGCVNRRFD